MSKLSLGIVEIIIWNFQIVISNRQNFFSELSKLYLGKSKLSLGEAKLLLGIAIVVFMNCQNCHLSGIVNIDLGFVKFLVRLACHFFLVVLKAERLFSLVF